MAEPPWSSHALVVGATLAPSPTPSTIAINAMTILLLGSPITAPR
ncbi:hypothetical protein [Microbacterium sp. CFBP9034]|nr:hypothetical protein [Microbacterium sp. CFBP9034]MDY0909427.1 hypothetical protein [Microbacterium sp. CFBP9034]